MGVACLSHFPSGSGAELEAALAAPGGLDHGVLESHSHELAELIERIAAAEERWLALSEMAA